MLRRDVLNLGLQCVASALAAGSRRPSIAGPETPSAHAATGSNSVALRNVLFIVADDHSAEVLGCYGNSIIHTPNLDRLASEGAMFRRAYANSPVCTPSRQSMITGKLPHACGVTLLQTPLPENQLTIAEHLKRFGFKTGAVGKMHFNSNLTHGFDYRVDTPDYQKWVQQSVPRKPPDGLRVKGPWRPFKDPARVWLNADMLPAGVYEENSDGVYLAQRAIQFLRENKGSRFCLWLGFYQPHAPFDFPIEFAGRYDPAQMPLPQAGPEDARWIPEVFRGLSEQDKRGIIASFYTAVEYLDKNVGVVLNELERLGLTSQTLVIYVGDNGYLLGHHGRFEKHAMWEPAVRCPLLIRHPQFKKGLVIPALAEFIDLAPTILESLGVLPMPGLQGRTLLPLLAGKSGRQRDYVFSEFLPDNTAMVRTEEWKYIFATGKADLAMGYATGYPPPGIMHRLYNLRTDPEEKRNLAADVRYRAVLNRLQQLMLKRFKETHPKASQLPPNKTIEEDLAWFCEPPDAK